MIIFLIIVHNQHTWYIHINRGLLFLLMWCDDTILTWQLSQLSLPHDLRWKERKITKKWKSLSWIIPVQYSPRRQSGGCYQMWWKRFVEKMSFEPDTVSSVPYDTQAVLDRKWVFKVFEMVVLTCTAASEVCVCVCVCVCRQASLQYQAVEDVHWLFQLFTDCSDHWREDLLLSRRYAQLPYHRV